MQQLSPIEIERIKSLFSKADSLIISAGAGMGVDSGLPDFRGNQGMWRAYPELGKQRIDFTEIANPAAFKCQPHLAWGFYGHRLALYRQTMPHQGFNLLKQLAETLSFPILYLLQMLMVNSKKQVLIQTKFMSVMARSTIFNAQNLANSQHGQQMN